MPAPHRRPGLRAGPGARRAAPGSRLQSLPAVASRSAGRGRARRASGLLPALDASLHDVSVAARRPGQLARVHGGALTGAAMKYGDPAFPCEGRQALDRMALGPGDALARMLVWSANVDQPRALIHKTLGFGR